MQETTIRDYIGREKEITATQIKNLPAGSKVRLHKFDRYGEHCTQDLIVTQSGRKKVLVTYDYWSGENKIYPIRKETDRFCYTRIKE